MAVVSIGITLLLCHVSCKLQWIYFIQKFYISFLVHVLQDKWRNLFDYLDITYDNLLDMADVKLAQDNYVRFYNLTAEEVCAKC